MVEEGFVSLSTRCKVNLPSSLERGGRWRIDWYPLLFIPFKHSFLNKKIVMLDVSGHPALLSTCCDTSKPQRTDWKDS